MKKFKKMSLLNKAEVLNEHEMKLVIGGSDYCATLFEIATRNSLNCGACHGANAGSAAAKCGFKLDCTRNCG